MIRVTAAAEPPSFNEKVRRPGLRAIAEMVGEEPAEKRKGPKRAARAVRREDLKSGDLPPYWRACTEDLLAAYHRICAYACLFIERVTGGAAVDHWAPKSSAWNRVYEWDNYRLACSLMNTRKNDFGDVLDPFDITEGVFALDLVTLKAVPGPKAGDKKEAVATTIQRLGLDGSDYSEALADYYHDYMEGDLSLRRLEKRAPFLAAEMRRQGRLKPGDR